MKSDQGSITLRPFSPSSADAPARAVPLPLPPPFPPNRRSMPGGAHEFMKAWDPEEDQIILEMVQAEGPKWKQIVKQLPGRTVRVASRRSRGLCMGLASP